MRRESLLAVTTALALLVLSREAYAQASETELATARLLFNEGVALEEKGDWPAALEKLRKVAAIRLTPQVRYNLGICLLHTGRLVEAWNELSPVATAPPDKKTAELVGLAQREVAKLRPRIPSLVVTLPPGTTAEVTLDGKAIHAELLGAPMLVDPGPHTVAASRGPGGGRVERRVTAVEGAAAPLMVALEAPPDAPPTSPVVSTWYGRIPLSAYLAGGASVAAFGGALVMLGLRGGAISSLNKACGGSGGHCPSSASGEYSDLKTYTIAGDVLLGVGITGAATAGGLVWLAPAASPSAHGSTWGATMTGRF
jgi:hypothetical protein